jgi:protocatechuate 3,4-dioxygenase beta subunit
MSARGLRPVITVALAALLALGLLGGVPAAAADAAIDGTVTSSSGAGLADVQVDAIAAGAVIATTRTSATGSYALDVADGAYSLTFTPPSGSAFSPATAVWVEAPRNWPLDVVLTTPTVGRVFMTGDVALDTGEPITGGSVMFAGSGNRQGSDGYFSMVHPAGATGGWMFSGSAQVGSATLFVNASRGPTMTVLQDTNTQLTVPVTTTTVTVTDASGAPIAGALVRLQVDGFGKLPGRVSITGGTTPFTMGWTASARSDAAGNVTVTRPLMQEQITGTLIVDPNDGRSQSLMTDAVIPAAGGAFPVRLTGQLVTMAGRVMFSDGSIVTGATVIPTDPTSPVNGGNSTDASGAFTVKKPSGFTGNWRVTTRASVTDGPGSMTLVLTGGAMRTWTVDGRVDFTIPRTTARVRVVDSSGNPVAGAVVRARAGEASGSALAQVRVLSGEPVFAGSWNAASRTGADGFADVPVLVAENTVTMSVTVDPPTPALLPRSVEVASSALPGTVITLGSAANVRATGRVSFSDGTPVIQATVIPTDPTSRVNGGNSADANGLFSVTKPNGFAGTWQVSSRPQASLAVRDPLWIGLRSSTLRRWTADFTQDITIPKTLYRVRVVDPAGKPVTHVRVSVRVDDTAPNPAAQVSVLAGEQPWTGSWAGWDFTGTDGIAQVPGVVMDNTVMTIVDVTTDPGSRFLPRTVSLRSSALSETVIVLQTLPISASSMSRTSAAPGDEVTITGSGFTGLTAVTVGGIPMEFTVASDTRVNARVPSNAITGQVTLTGASGSASPGRLTVTSRDLRIDTATLPAGMVGSVYDMQLTASGGLAPFTWRRTSGALPTGITLSTSGRLAGTPTRALSGSAGFTVTDARGGTVTRVVSWTMAPRPATQPGPIARITASPGASRISLAWAAPVDNGGNVITAYRIEQSTDGTTWTTVVPSTGTTSLGISLAVGPQVPMWFRVAAINAAGVGRYGDRSVVGPIAAFDVPGAPINVSLSRPSPSKVTVTWQPPTTTGGSPVTGYRVRTSLDGRSWTTIVNTTRATSVTIGAAAGRDTWVQVSAITIAGLSPYTTVGPVR